jgi:hypothetical protein
VCNIGTSHIRCPYPKILGPALNKFSKPPSARSSITPNTTALLFPAVLDLGPEARHCLDLSLGACRRLIPHLRACHRLVLDLVGVSLLDIGFPNSSTAPVSPASPQRQCGGCYRQPQAHRHRRPQAHRHHHQPQTCLHLSKHDDTSTGTATRAARCDSFFGGSKDLVRSS